MDRDKLSLIEHLVGQRVASARDALDDNEAREAEKQRIILIATLQKELGESAKEYILLINKSSWKTNYDLTGFIESYDVQYKLDIASF